MDVRQADFTGEKRRHGRVTGKMLAESGVELEVARLPPEAGRLVRRS